MRKSVRRIAVLASGGGTTLQAVIDAISQKTLEVFEIAIVISDNPYAYALTRAQMNGIKTHVLTADVTAEEGDKELKDVLESANVDLVLLLGYLKLIGPITLSHFPVVNTHPSLLPKYGGKGMHGMNVHMAVVKNEESESGVTLHWANGDYDKGQVIWQTKVPVYPSDNPRDVSDRVQMVEKTQLVYLLKAFTERKIDFPELN